MFFGLFLIIGAGTVLYAEGYRLDSKTWSAKKVGAIYVAPNPRKADIKLDGEKIEKNNGLFQNGTLIGGVFPERHVLELSLAGYQSWKRSVEVFPSKVTEVLHALLIPESREQLSDGYAKNFWIVGEKILSEGYDGLLSYENRAIAEHAPVSWSRNRASFLTRRTNGDLRFYNFNTATSTSILLYLKELGIPASASSTKIILDDQDSSEILATNGKILAVINPLSKNSGIIFRTSSGVITAIDATRDKIAWSVFDPTSGSSTIKLYDRFTRRVTSVLEKNLQGKIKRLEWANEDRLGFIDDADILYLLNPKNGEYEIRAKDVRDINFSPSGNELVVLGKQSIEAFSFTNDRKNYTRFNLRDLKDIISAEWHKDGHNLFLHYVDKIMLLEINDSLIENMGLAVNTSNGFYDADTNSLYYLENGKVFAARFGND